MYKRQIYHQPWFNRGNFSAVKLPRTALKNITNDANFSSLFQKRTKSRLVIFCRGSKYAGSRHDGTHAAPRGTQRYRKAGTGAMADSASYAYGAQRAVAQRKRWAQADEDVAATKPRGGGETAPGISENIMRISRARPGRRPVRLESRGPGRADGA